MRSTLPPGLVVAGTRSGCGKTSVALGLMRAATRRGHAVQGFKVGPDFIDPGLHALATGRPSHNLDGWMCPADVVRDIYARRAAGTDLAVVEGVMGLFDGFSATDEAGSTAQAAKLLGAPVILVVDAASMARSVAALAGGYLAFDPGLAFAGVICNNAASPSHAALIAEAMAAALPRVPLLGVLPRLQAVSTPSRHLGLVTADDLSDTAARLDALADWLEEACDVDRVVMKASGGQGAALDPPGGIIPPGPPGRGVRIGVARDRAFCFYYEENFRHLAEAGAELVPFSPLADAALPEGLAGLYLGGGYPELSGGRLAANAGLRRALRDFCLAGRPVLAECGGFMLLMEALTDLDGREHPMAGVFPFQAAMGPKMAALGYRQVTTLAETPLGPAGTVLRGHEFHYSSLVRDDGAVPGVYALAGRQGNLAVREGFLVGRTLGSYVHLHFGSNPRAARHFVAACQEGA
jgi:cobyrinic acid a,c-diamide synthase